MKKAKGVISRLSLLLFSYVRVHVIHDQVTVLLVEGIEGGAFGKDFANQAMCVFQSALLEGGTRITIENVGAAVAIVVEFKGRRVAEFTAIVGKDEGKELREAVRAQLGIQGIENLRDGVCVIGRAEKGEKDHRLTEKEGEEDLAAAHAFDGIHLHDGEMGMQIEEGKKVLVRAPASTVAFHLDRAFFPTRAVADGFGQIHTFGIEETGIDIAIQGGDIAHDGIFMGLANMVEGLTLANEGRD